MNQQEMAPLINGYSLVAQALKLNHISVVYGVTGIPVTQLSRTIQQNGMRYIGMHNEQAAGYAAGAEGFITGKPGVCLTVSAPGFLNGLSGLANATVNCFPMILISGSSSAEMIDLQQGDYQELDQLNAARNFAKQVYKIDAIELVPTGIARAVRAAASGRPGGVYLDIPAHVLHQTIPAEQAKELLFAPIDPQPKSIPSDEAVKRALALLKTAKKPLIILGKGAAYSRAEIEIAKFIELTNIPFLPSPMGKGIMPSDHPLSAEAAHSLVLKNADVAVLIGARLNWIMQHGKPPVWSENCAFIQLEICPDEIDSNVPIAAPIIGDISSSMSRLLALAPGYKISPPIEWLSDIAQNVAQNKKKLVAKIEKATQPMSFSSAFGVLKQEMARYPELFFVSEGANTLDIGRAIIPLNKLRKRLDAGTWGTMGIGLAYAIAAATATGCPVLAAEGDCAFGFSADPDPTRFLDNIQYELLIEAFKGKGYHAANLEDLRYAIRESLAAQKPALINCMIDPTDGTESGHLAKMN